MRSVKTEARVRATRWLLASTALLLAACPQEEVVTTTRNLDRPGPLALVCAARVGDAGITTGLSPSNCTPDAGVKGTLYGFVANTSRGEVAVFRGLAHGQGGEPLVDLDRRSPGFGFIPVGNFPTDLKATRDGCRVVSANAGSCDLSVIDVPSVLMFAAGQLQTPSGAAVSRVVPRTASGAPLRSQPQEIVLVPASMPEKPVNAACPAKSGGYRAYVSFPRCNLVAELDLGSGKIVHGVQMRPDGSFVLTTEPACPVDCLLAGERQRPDAGRLPDGRAADGRADLRPVDGARPDAPRDAGPPPIDRAPREATAAQDLPRPLEAAADRAASDRSRDGGAEAGKGAVSPLGVLPSGLALTETGERLYISSAGAGFVSVVDISTTGAFENARAIPLADGPTTTRIRLSPRTRRIGRFLYAVAGDRTVRVISTDLEKECETQLDLLAVPSPEAGVPLERARCYPVGGPDTPPRRITAQGHGFTFGARIPQDVAFVESQASLPDGGVPEAGPPATPLRGVYAIVATSDATTFIIDVEDWNFIQPTSSAVSRLHLPHRLRNELQGTPSSIPDASIATVSGGGQGGVPALVSKSLPEGTNDSPAAPTLPGEGVFLRTLGDPVATQTQLVYEERLVARWSGDVRVTRDGLSLNDPAVDFCAADVQGTILENGRKVQHGDIAVLVGCKDDTECGLEQSCQKPIAVQTDFGLCLDKSRIDELLQACSDFLRSDREWLVRGASVDSLQLDALPVEPQAVIRQPTQPAGGCKSNADCEPYFLCAIEDQLVAGQPARSLRAGECFRPGCNTDADCGPNRCVQPIDGSPPVCSTVPLPIEVNRDLTCATDSDCRPKTKGGAPCANSRACGDPLLECRSAITGGENVCIDRNMVCSQSAGYKGRCVRKSPCFAELQRYDVRVGRSFLVSGGYRRGQADPVTRECRPDPSKSPLLVQRVPIGLPVYPVLLGPSCNATVAPLQVPQPDPCFERTPSGYVGYTAKAPGSSITFTDVGPSTVVRYANPDLWFSVGLSHLIALPSTQLRPDAGVAAPIFAPMPARGLTVTLNVQSGFSPLRPPTATNLSLPTRIEEGPDGFVYIVDTGDRSGSTGSRGQVVRISRETIVLDGFTVR